MTPEYSRRHVNPTYGLLAIFAFLLVLTAALFYSYGRDVEYAVQDRIVKEELERSRSQARDFAKKVKEALENSRFAELIDSGRKEILDFDHLADKLLKQNRYVAYVHLQDENGETLMFKGPELIQKVVFRDESVTFMERSTESMRFLKLNDGSIKEGITDIATPLLSDEGDGKALGQLRVGLSNDKLSEYSSKATERQRKRLSKYLLLATLLFILAFVLLRYHLWRVRKLEDSLHYQTRMAYVGSLASGLVHELRNPINSINLNLSLLEEEISEIGSDVTSVNRLLRRIKPGLGHLEKVSQEFLEFARPPEVKIEEVDIAKEIADVRAMVESQNSDGKVEFIFEPSQELKDVKLDRARLRQILFNLMSNGIQAMPHGGELKLEARCEGDSLKIVISDTGEGMSEEAQKNLFKLFYTTKEGGVGLGLPIVKRMVLDLDGEIEVLSKKGEGTTFIVSFPTNGASSNYLAVSETEGDARLNAFAENGLSL